MFQFALTLSAMLGPAVVAQATPYAPAAILNNGPCMDSPRSVPHVLQAPAVPSMQVVRIDRVTSTASLTQNEVIGFLYTLQDGSTWLGQRSPDYMSAAQARQINQVLASTHLPGEAVNAFPPQSKLGLATKYQQFFKVDVPPGALDPLKIRIDPCVAWPAGTALPDPGR